MTPLPVYVDTDLSLGTPQAEIDDGAALRLLLRSPEVEVGGVGTVHGNVPMAAATDNLRRLLAYEGRQTIPVGRGAALPLVEDPRWFDAWQAGYGPTPPWPGDQDWPAAANLLIDLVRARPQALTVLALGPLTNLALAARLAPDIVPLVREVIAMGGSFGGEAAPAEFNFRCDPEAAAVVLGASWPVRLFGLEVTRRVHFARADFAALPADPPTLALLKHQAPAWIDRVEAQGWDAGGCSLHDAVAAAALVEDGLCGYAPAGVAVELHDRARRGTTRLNPQGTGARLAVEIDAPRCHAFILTRLTA